MRHVIELILKQYLDSVLDVPVLLEHKTGVTVPYVLLDKTGGSESNHLKKATVAIQSYGTSLYNAAKLNEDVIRAMDGLTTLDTGVVVKSNSTELKEHVIVIELVLRDNVLKRIVIPQGKVTEIGEIKYVDGDDVGYETTVTCFPDDNSNTHYEYIVKPKAGGDHNA